MSTAIQDNPRVKLEPVAHKYFDQYGTEYISVSKLLSLVSEKFDAERMAVFTARKQGKTVEQVLAEWDKIRDDAANHGTRIHNALERYEKENGLVLPEDRDLTEMIESVMQIYRSYPKSFSELCLWHDEYKVAGTTDKLCYTANSKTCTVDFYDYKTNLSKGITYDSKYNKYLLDPVSHLQDCSYNKYALQLSLYALFFEYKTGRKIGKLNLIYIPPTNYLDWKLIPMPYMKLEAMAILNHYKNSLS